MRTYDTYSKFDAAPNKTTDVQADARVACMRPPVSADGLVVHSCNIACAGCEFGASRRRVSRRAPRRAHLRMAWLGARLAPESRALPSIRCSARTIAAPARTESARGGGGCLTRYLRGGRRGSPRGRPGKPALEGGGLLLSARGARIACGSLRHRAAAGRTPVEACHAGLPPVG